MMDEEPEWESVPSSSWKIRYAGWYQIDKAKPVCVGTSYKSQNEALGEARAVLDEKLHQIVGMGLSVEAKTWTVKQKERTQYQNFDPVYGADLVTAYWYNRFTVVNKASLNDENCRRYLEEE